MRRRPLSRLLVIAALAGLLVLPMPASAQDTGTDQPDCQLLTRDEVAGALGSEVTRIEGDEFFCTWQTATGDVVVGTSDSGGLQAARDSWPGGVETTVGDLPAYYSAEAGQLWLEVAGQVLYLALQEGDGPDAQAVLSGLAALAAPRVPAAPTPVPGGLEALFPDVLGGQPVQVRRVPPDQVAQMIGANDPAALEQFQAALASQGKSLGDVEIAFGGAAGAQIVAYRIAGADAAAFGDAMEGALGANAPGTSVAPGQVSGKAVRIMSVDGQPTAVVYPSGDTLWVVIATEPVLTEAIGALP